MVSVEKILRAITRDGGDDTQFPTIGGKGIYAGQGAGRERVARVVPHRFIGPVRVPGRARLQGNDTGAPLKV